MDFYDQEPSEYGDLPGRVSEAEINSLEKMFISKLTEKYRLIDRDLKKGCICFYSYTRTKHSHTHTHTSCATSMIYAAFGQFDTDRSGLLETKELVAAIKSYLNGVDDMKIRHLCRKFDPYGEGRVSYHEFTRYLIATGEGRYTYIHAYIHTCILI